MQRGNLTAAYKQYRNHVLFPAIISRICPEPCRGVCTRNGVDSSIFMRSLEAACVAFTRSTEPVPYNVPAKPYSVAIIGAGLCGLSCALKLASRNYKVTVYESGALQGGQIGEILSTDVFLEEFRLQFSTVEYELVVNTPIQTLEEITADAIFVATGKNGNSFGLLEGLDKDSLGSTRNGVFLGGSLLGVPLIESMEHGIRASYSIEKFLKVGAMDGMPETYTKPKVNPKYYNLPISPLSAQVVATQPMSAEQAIEESKRCPRCNCSLCFDSCELMQWAKSYPKNIVTKVISSLGSKEHITQRRGLRMLNACTQCGLCRDICPEGVDMQEYLLEARRSLCDDGVQPPVYHDFWLRDMQFTLDEAAFCHLPERRSGERAEYLFFPGCQLGASSPDYVHKVYEYLAVKFSGTGLLVSCCGIPAEWAGEVHMHGTALQYIEREWRNAGYPTMILACPTCAKTFVKHLPHIKTISLYTLLADIYNELPVQDTQFACVYDPCASRGDEKVKASVRELATRAGVHLKDLPKSLAKGLCCGFGGHINMVDLELHQSILRQRVVASETEYITYCSNCRDGFSGQGKACRHILDILFTDGTANRKPPLLGERRLNRLLVQSKYTQQDCVAKEPALRLHIPYSLCQKMNKLLIMEEEVHAVIMECESMNTKFLHVPSGQFRGCKQIGCVTCWVAWHEDDGMFVLDNVYTHRMKIQG